MDEQKQRAIAIVELSKQVTSVTEMDFIDISVENSASMNIHFSYVRNQLMLKGGLWRILYLIYHKLKGGCMYQTRTPKSCTSLHAGRGF